MAVTAAVGVPAEVTLATTVTLITRGTGANFAEVTSSAALFLVLDDALADGAAVPASARHQIPANTPYIVDLRGKRALIAAQAATPTASVLGFARDPRRQV